MISLSLKSALMDVGGKLLNRESQTSAKSVQKLASTLFNQGGNGASSAPINPRGRRSVLEAAQSRSDPLMNFNWHVELPVISPKSGGSSHLSWEYVEEATVPFVEFDVVSNYQAGKNVHYPNHYSIGTLGLKLYEDSQGSATEYLNTWQRAMFNSATGLFNFPTDFKRPIQVWILDVAKLTVMCLEYTGCWPTRIDQFSLSSSSSDRVVAGVEFSVDGLNIKIGKFTDSQVPSLMASIGSTYPPTLSAVPSAFPSVFTNFSI